MASFIHTKNDLVSNLDSFKYKKSTLFSDEDKTSIIDYKLIKNIEI